jgi:hypothetical protein
MKKQIFILIALIAGLVLSSCKGGQGTSGPSGADMSTAVFQQGVFPAAGYSGAADAMLDQGSPDSNDGTWTYTLFGLDPGSAYRQLIRFDVSYIVPKSVSVLSAELTLYLQADAGVNTGTVYELTRGFVENGATWNSYDGVNSWTSPGGDYNPAAMSDPVYFDGSAPTITFHLNPAMVQNWIANPGQNYGIIITASNETTGSNWARFYSADYTGNNLQRPALTIKYRLP